VKVILQVQKFLFVKKNIFSGIIDGIDYYLLIFKVNKFIVAIYQL